MTDKPVKKNPKNSQLSKASSGGNLSWFKSLVENLRPSNLTRPQKANLLLDALGVVCFLALVATTNEDCWKVISFLGILGFAAWCHNRSAPKTKMF